MQKLVRNTLITDPLFSRQRGNAWCSSFSGNNRCAYECVAHDRNSLTNSQENKTQGSSKPQIENGSNLQGPDSPISVQDELQVSRNSVSFSDFVRERTFLDVEAHDVVDEALTAEELRRQRDGYLFGCCPFDSDLFADFLSAQDLVEQVRDYEVQSGEARDMAYESTTQKHAMTTMTDDTPTVEMTFMTTKDDTYYAADSPDCSMAEYLARPVKLSTLTWTVGTAFPNTVIDPLALWTANKRVINRLATYKNFKCDLCVKIMVNGSPFHYGCLLASHSVYAAPDWYFDSSVVGSIGNLVSQSQLPHIYVDPTTSQGGCFRLPYMRPLNAYDLVAGNQAAAHLLNFRSIIPLAHANAAVDAITITIMAWAENVVLSVPTQVAPFGYVPQSGDEYGSGPISHPSFIISALAGKMKGLPLIGPYAMATSIGAQAIGNIARMFGFVKPRIVTPTSIMRPRFVPNLSSATEHEAIQVIAFDEKAETTVDPRVAGWSPMDEMSFSSIVQRESYLTNFSMAPTDAPDTKLFSIAVTPVAYLGTLSGLDPVYWMTPCCHLAMPFRYWRGSMKYRFQAVASSFHRARLRFVYEPSVGTSAPAHEYGPLNSYVWDISDSKDTVLEIGWHTEIPYLEVSPPLNSFPMFQGIAAGVQPTLSPIAGAHNGMLHVYVMNELTAPSNLASSSIAFTVHVAGSDDLDFMRPTEDKLATLAYVAQSGELMQDVAIAPVMRGVDVTFGKKTEKVSEIQSIHHGDPVHSVRTLIKRYCRAERISIFFPAGIVAWAYRSSGYVFQPGQMPGAIHLNGATPVNFSHMNYLAWFSPCYLGRRGGIRNRIVPVVKYDNPITVDRWSSVTLPTNATTVTQLVGQTDANFVSKDAVQIANIRNTGLAGKVVAMGGEPLDFELPYNSNLRFIPTRQPDPTVWDNSGFDMRSLVNAASAGSVAFDRFVSAGDDFTFVGYLNVPPVRNRKVY